MKILTVPFFRPDVQEQEIEEVVATLRSGWLTSGPRVKRFEQEFAAAVGASHAVALNSGTAALHLAVEALGLRAGQGVLVPTMTFAATAEVVRYQGAIPILVDCDPVTLNMDLNDAARKLEKMESADYADYTDVQNTKPQNTRPQNTRPSEIVGIMPVHVGGMMMDINAIKDFAAAHDLWIVEDAAHAFPAAWRSEARDQKSEIRTHHRDTESTEDAQRFPVHQNDGWQRCGQGTATVSCFSFYANKTITTGEGGMAVTEDEKLAERMRLMSLHGLSQDAWERYATPSDAGTRGRGDAETRGRGDAVTRGHGDEGTRGHGDAGTRGHGDAGTGGTGNKEMKERAGWDYKIIAPGYKYNLADIAAAIGIHQLSRAEEMRREREAIARLYIRAFSDVDQIELPPLDANRIHSWHLFPIKLRLEKLSIDRNQFIEELKEAGVGYSVHWRPLHLHPYYQETFGWRCEDFPHASHVWERLVSLPLFPGMRRDEIDHVIETVREICKRRGC